MHYCESYHRPDAFSAVMQRSVSWIHNSTYLWHTVAGNSFGVEHTDPHTNGIVAALVMIHSIAVLPKFWDGAETVVK